jgi:PEP-CTERM motif
MLNKTLKKLIFFSLLSTPAFSSSNMEIEVGVFKNAAGDTLFSGTWALILDVANNKVLPGNIPATSMSSNSHLLTVNATAAAMDFSGVTLSEGTMIGGARIQSLGTITGNDNLDFGAGYGIDGLISFADDEENLAYGIYWFPNMNLGSTLPTSGTFEVGGFFQSDIETFAAYGTFSPPAGVFGELVALDSSPFRAITVTAVPEPSTFLLSAFAGLALLRRSRKN